MATTTLTAVAVIIAVSLIANFGQVCAPPPVGHGFIYVAAETAPGGALTRYFKVGGTGNGNQNRRRSSLNTGNPRHLQMIYFTPVGATRAAETAVHNALAAWHVNLGGGREWYFVPPAQWINFSTAFTNAVNQFAG